MRILGLLVLAGALVVTAAAAPPRAATVSTFAGEWRGHTRSLLITRTGQAEEVVDDGCCTRVISAHFKLLRPSGTVTDAAVALRVTVRRWDAPGHRPRVGQLGRLRLRDGILVDLLTGMNYCNDRARPVRARLCGA